MKFHYAITAFLSIAAGSNQLNSASAETDDLERNGTFRWSSRRLMTKPCTLLLRVTDHEDKGQTRDVDCFDPSTGAITDISGNGVQKKLLSLFDDGELESNKSTLYSGTGRYTADSELEIDFDKATFGETSGPDRMRSTEPNTLYAFAVRIVANNIPSEATEDELSDYWFGTNGDPVNIKSQYKACSFGQLLYEPSTSELLNQDGAHTINIANNPNGVDNSVIREAAKTELANDLGITSNELATMFDHVMLCVPPGTNGGWIAYAYINSWLSVYNNLWCNYVSVQMHEIGHNLGLAHSGETSGYDDTSGMMGYSYSQNDTPKMCFNAAKGWQLGWYSDKRHSTNTGWSGRLYGIVDYETSPSSAKVVIQITGGSTDWYVSFNRKAGFNEGTKEGSNQVMVHDRAKGQGYATSKVWAKLSANGSYNGAQLPIKVLNINLGANPAYAEVEIGSASPPTDPPVRATVPPVRPPKPTTKSPVRPTKPPTPTSDPTMLPTNNLVYTGWRLWTLPEATSQGFAWDVADVKLYQNSNCEGTYYNTGVAISSGHYPSPSWVPERAFDDSMNTFWGGRASGSPRAFFIGMDFGTETRNIQCVSMLDRDEHGVTSLVVQGLSKSKEWIDIIKVDNLVTGERHDIPLTSTEPPATTPSTDPTSGEPSSGEPTSGEPTSGEPTTSEPTTSEPTTSEPTSGEPGDICATGEEDTCVSFGCIWKKDNCEACSVHSNKKKKNCVKDGCNWEADESCQSCNIGEDKDDCKAKSCVWTKVDGIGKMCTPCAAVTDSKKCKKAKCVWKSDKCASCVTLKKKKDCKKQKKVCSWKGTLGCIMK